MVVACAWTLLTACVHMQQMWHNIIASCHTILPAPLNNPCVAAQGEIWHMLMTSMAASGCVLPSLGASWLCSGHDSGGDEASRVSGGRRTLVKPEHQAPMEPKNSAETGA